MRPAPVSSAMEKRSSSLPELAVVAALGLLELLEVLLELFPGEEGVPVDALHLGVAFLALPVRLRRAVLELERLDLPGGLEVRAQAEVDELAHRVALDLLARLLADELALQGLALAREQLQRFRLRDEALLDGPVLLDDVRHLLLDGGEVFRRERPRHQEVVEEAVVGGRTDAALRFREQLGHRRRQQVGGRMAVDLERAVGWLGFSRRSGGVRRFVGGRCGRHLRGAVGISIKDATPSGRAMVGAGGIEPPTSSVSRRRSTTEPRAYVEAKPEGYQGDARVSTIPGARARQRARSRGSMPLAERRTTPPPPRPCRTSG